MSCKLNYVKDKHGLHLLPFQFYDKYNKISFPTMDKVPQVKNWPNLTKTVPQFYSNNNIALLTGKVNNLTVLDIDTGGLEAWNKLLNGKELNTPMVKTPGGLHVYFKYNSTLKTSNRLYNRSINWDIRNDKGSIIAVPSIIDGKRYKWVPDHSIEDKTLKKMPTWLEEFIISGY